jgi:thiamine pyrophosphate-dependent acetolactate synthase large subunit-like protein
LVDTASKDAISAFSDSQYDNAVKCLTEVVAQHSSTLMEYPPVKEGDTKDLKKLHTTWTQHIRALADLGHVIDSAFLTSILERKLDKDT